jgi:hypothetical protein
VVPVVDPLRVLVQLRSTSVGEAVSHHGWICLAPDLDHARGTGSPHAGPGKVEVPWGEPPGVDEHDASHAGRHRPDRVHGHRAEP